MNPVSSSSESSSKHENRDPVVENTASGVNNSTDKDQKRHFCGSSSSESSLLDGPPDHSRNPINPGKRSRQNDWNRDRFVNSHDMYRGKRNEFQDRLRDDPTSYHHNYAYNGGTEASFIDSSGRACVMPAYGLMNATNSSQWGTNPLDGRTTQSSTMEMNTNTGASMHPFAYMGMLGDANPYGMMGMGNFGMIGGDANVLMTPPKETFYFSKSVLYPPNPNIPIPNTRPKPMGCKTVYVGGIPDNADEEILREAFERCGEVVAVRINKGKDDQRPFCHIRFSAEAFIENAIYLSGYRIKIGDKDDNPNTGKLHVDYANARDDQYEYECRQRSLQREARHRERLEQEFYRPPTPPPVVHYSDHEATILSEKLRGEDTFQQALFILITWLERGECNKRSAGYFYSMIQSANSHVRRLMNEKLKYEDELNKAKIMLKQQMRGILLQFTDIGKVFTTASLQKVWDHFTKAQRKNIDLWKKQTEEIKNAHVEEVLNDRIEDEMDVSEDEDYSSKNTSSDSVANVSDHMGSSENSTDEVNKLREENDNLRCQLKASENEIILLKSETDHERVIHEFQMQTLRDAMHTAPKDRLFSQRAPGNNADLKELQILQRRKRDTKLEKEIGESSHDRDEKNVNIKDFSEETSDSEIPRGALGLPNSVTSTTNNLRVVEPEARLIGLISTFLNVHPFGASVDYICSYLYQIDNTVRARDVEALMKKFPTVFKEESTGIGASLEKKWTFCGFKS